MEGEAEYGFIVSLDAQGSGQLTDPEKLDMRRTLYDVSGRAFADADIRAPHLYQEDRGDGILCVLKATVPPVRVVGVWLEYLHQNLRESNRGPKVPLRLRVGMHIGPVTTDPHGLSGRAVDLACRLGDCGTAKDVLAAASKSPLVVVVSERVYEDVVQAGGRWVEPEYYRSFDVDLKEGRRTAWFLVPGLPEPPLPEPGTPPALGPAADAPGTAPQRAETARPGVVNNSHGSGDINNSYASGDIYNNFGSGEIIRTSDRIGVININKPSSPPPADGDR